MYSADGELEWSVDFHTKEGLAESNEARADFTTPYLLWAAGEIMCHSPHPLTCLPSGGVCAGGRSHQRMSRRPHAHPVMFIVGSR